MTTIIILVFIYIALVYIAFGMLCQHGNSGASKKLDFMTAALMLWAAVPFLILMTFGRWIVSVNSKLVNE